MNKYLYYKTEIEMILLDNIAAIIFLGNY